ncbi:MAG: imidazole glycerol phosphate synthase subunit HisH [Steroidobacteraceae bacterium]
MTDVAIIDNGGANIASLRHALERLGASSVLTTDVAILRGAPRVLLPGVGAAADAMERLRAAGLVEAIRVLEQPVLGICLGMQLLFGRSEEGDTACLGIIDGRVGRFADAPDLPVPHMGWNRLAALTPDPLLDGLRAGEHVYFVHSYRAPLGPWTVATSDYGGGFSAVVRQRNFAGAQFHPERSGPAGARVLANFLKAA